MPSDVVEHVGKELVEVDVVGVGAKNRTAPIEAVGTNIADHTIAGVAGARHGQFQW